MSHKGGGARWRDTIAAERRERQYASTRRWRRAKADDPEWRRARADRQKVYYHANKEVARRRRDERLALLNVIKQVPCLDCGGSFPPICMDFDHRDPSTKTANVSYLVNCTLERLMAEVAMCDIVCANCHRVRTHGA